MAATSSVVAALRKAQRAEGPATIMAIGTANPPNVLEQSTYPDYYFRVTNNEDQKELKDKFRRICDKTMIKKRHFVLTEDILKANPNLCAYMAPSLDTRQDMAAVEIPKLGKEAASLALEEWGRPKSDITHLVFCCTGGVDMPGPDHKLIKLLGLQPTVKRVMLFHQACYAGGTALRVAKDLAENNRGARVLAVSVELTLLTFRGMNDTRFDNLVGQALFADGAAAAVVGADPVPGVERPIFEMVATAQMIAPNSDGYGEGQLRQVGLTLSLKKQVPNLLADNVETILKAAFEPLGISDWNSLFWSLHPGGRAILDGVEAKLALKPEKLRASRSVLSEYGNMSSASVVFILDEMRRWSAKEGKSTTGEGLEWGVLVGFGPGLTMEAVVLHSVPV